MADGGDPTMRRSTRANKGKPPHRYGQEDEATPKQNVLQRVMGFIFGTPNTNAEDAKSTTTSASTRSKKSALDGEIIQIRDGLDKEIRDRKLQNVRLKQKLCDAQQELDDLKDSEDQTKEVKDRTKELQRQINKDQADVEANEVYLEDLNKDLEKLAEKQRIAREIIEEDDNDSQKLSEDEDNNSTKEEEDKDATDREQAKRSNETEKPDDATKKWVDTIDPDAAKKDSEDDEVKELTEKLLKIKSAESDKVEQGTTKSNVAPNAQPTDPMAAALMAIANAQTQMAEVLKANQAKENAADTMIARSGKLKDLPYFDRRHEQWPAFIAEYGNTTAECKYSNSENLARLRKALKGEAKACVESMMVSPENVPNIMERLKVRFGQPEHIIMAMAKKARSVANVHVDKPQTFIDFTTAVANLTATIKGLKLDRHLENPILVNELEAKLPTLYQVQWSKHAEAKGNNLSELTSWAEGEMKYRCQPWTLKHQAKMADKIRTTGEKKCIQQIYMNQLAVVARSVVNKVTKYGNAQDSKKWT